MTPFQRLHHICIVVHDMERAVGYYESLGLGPWQNFPSLTAFADDLQAPSNEDFLKLAYRFCQLENVQLQLCAPPPGNTPQRRHLEKHGEGVFHLGFQVDQCDDGERTATELGLTLLLRGRLPNGHGFSYFDTKSEGAGITLQIRSTSTA
ncbi:VOC family protein [Pseudomonas putida]|nr:VOC family protein [Pseudomonas putida]